ncbi:MAG TPA: site-specific DNA-methyltransferase [Methanoregula sp.]|nr:site-specific DNA-methyltransferase [Methanoregula sp.]
MAGKNTTEPDEDIVKNEYLKLVTTLKKPLTIHEKRLLQQIQKKFSKKGFRLDINKSEITLYLQSIEFETFRDYVQDLLDKTKNNHDSILVDKEIFLKIIEDISRIKSYGIKEGKRWYVTYRNERKVKDRQSKAKRRGLYYYAQDNTFSKKNNEFPKRYENLIMNADSESVLKQLPDNCTDLIITSPPYNFGLGYDTSPDGVNWEHYFEKLFAVFDECIRIVKFGGRIIINIQPLFSDYIPSHHIISHHFMQKKMIWKGEILWEKNNYNCKYCAWGSWKSPSSPYLKYTWEFLEIFAKGDIKKSGRSEDIDIHEDEFKRWVVAKWSVAPEKKMNHYDHPAMFPEELVTRALKLFSFEGDVILDPFNGAGTTCVVAKKTKRKFMGIDISKKYCDIAKKRLTEIS